MTLFANPQYVNLGPIFGWITPQEVVLESGEVSSLQELINAMSSAAEETSQTRMIRQSGYRTTLTYKLIE